MRILIALLHGICFTLSLGLGLMSLNSWGIMPVLALATPAFFLTAVSSLIAFTKAV